MKTGMLAVLALAVLGVSALAACTGAETPPSPLPVFSEEQNRQVAHDFVVASPTFRFDGMPETLELTATRTDAVTRAFTFTYEFDSRHAGYGDRTGQALAQVITPHQASITVENGKVSSAIMDEDWDMQAQKLR